MSRTVPPARTTRSSSAARTQGRPGSASSRGPRTGTGVPLRLASQRRRGAILLLATGMVLTVFGARLVDLQAVRGETLAAEALDQRLRTSQIPADRGTILDDGGEPLAVTMEARNVTADQTLVTDPAAVAAQLGPILGADPAVLSARLTGDRRFVYLAKGLTPQVWDRISELRLPGIFSEPAARRVYPAGDLAANVVGFVGDESTGLGGIEYAFQDQLAGTAASRPTSGVRGDASSRRARTRSPTPRRARRCD